MVVNAGYYLVAAEYFKVKADYAPYYKNALLYLACIDEKKELSEQDMRQRAHDLCIAALLGETIYNFGELVRVSSLLQTWLTSSYYTQSYRPSLVQNGNGSRVSSQLSTQETSANSIL